ncbi:TVP38/TMEM64 family membrane protein [Enterobacter cancerogenus]|uniref:TVP38/TMEM64 family membrane protein n=1 Tax=Enterobacter cancerogenus TaxID=69218 RepID=A0A484Z7H5_9ENTR|nr:TVP38/TMEM64 family membrane protein [Enterobacter cancerogenus]
MLVSFASTLGATLAMLASRYVLREWVQQRFARQMSTVNAGMDRDGARYLFALRLMPLFPFFLVNLLMGLTHLSVRRYWWISQLAMLPATAIFLNAGRELGKLTRPGDILSPGLVFALTLLGLLPLVTRWLFSRYPLSSKK